VDNKETFTACVLEQGRVYYKRSVNSLHHKWSAHPIPLQTLAHGLEIQSLQGVGQSLGMPVTWEVHANHVEVACKSCEGYMCGDPPTWWLSPITGLYPRPITPNWGGEETTNCILNVGRGGWEN